MSQARNPLIYILRAPDDSSSLYLMPEHMRPPVRVFLQCFVIAFTMLIGFRHIFSALVAAQISGTRATQVVLSDASAQQPQTGNVAYTLPTERTFLLNVPTGYKHEEPHPLVLSFHGGQSPPALQLTGSRTDTRSPVRQPAVSVKSNSASPSSLIHPLT